MDRLTKEITSYFDSRGWKYALDIADDEVESIFISFSDEQEQIRLRINVFTKYSLYIILGGMDIQIDPLYMDLAYKVVNEFNNKSNFVTATVIDERTISFWISRTTDIEPFSIKSFHRNLMNLHDAISNYTPKLYVKLSKEQKSKKNGFLSFFSINK